MSDKVQVPGFLKGGGEMGELIWAYDWRQTALGAPEQWPLSLKTTVGIMLHSAFPMFLFWGDELLCFYNDAYRPSLGIDGKHPMIGKGGEESWPDIWHFIGPLIDKVMSTGEAVWFEDQLLPIYRNGGMEDVYWTFSYSPAYGDEGEIRGVFVTCTETTGKVAAIGSLEKEKAKFKSLIEEAPLATCLFTGPEMCVEIANDIVLAHWGKGKYVIGKPLIEVLPEIKGQAFPAILDKVYATGETYEAKGARADLVVNGIPGTYYYDFTYKAVRDAEGQIYGVISMSMDVTAQVLALRQLEKSQEELVEYFEQTPVAIAIISKENLTFRLVNAFYAELVGRKPGEINNKPLLEALPELAGQGFDDLLNGVIATGIAYTANEVAADLKRNGALETIYVNLTYQPQHDVYGTITGILVVATDVTQQVRSRRKVEESEAHLQLLRDTVPAMIFYLDEEERYRTYNVVFKEWFGVNGTEAIGKTVREFIGEAAYEKVSSKLKQAYGGAQAKYELLAPTSMQGPRWLSIVYTPHISDGKVIGVIVHAMDITHSKQAEMGLRDSEARFRELIQEAPVATCFFMGRDMKIELANEIMLDIWGKDRTVLGKPLKVALPELVGQPFLDILDNIYNTGVAHSETAARADLEVNGKLGTYYFNYTYKPLFNAAGEVYGIMDMAIDVTEQVLVQKRIQESQEELLALFEDSPVGIAMMSADNMVFGMVNKFYSGLAGRTPEQMTGKTLLEALPEIAGQGYDELLRGVIESKQPFEIKESPVTVVKNGQPETIYVNVTYQPKMEADGKVGSLLMVAIDVTSQVLTRQKIEEAVALRTEELAEANLNLVRSNSELEQFAYIASHDLQEPVRKISTFTQMLEHSIGDRSEQSDKYIKKIYSSTERMTKLIRDVLAFSQISQHTETFSPVDLNEIIAEVRTDFELLIEKTQATIVVGKLPVVEAIPSQMVQLFGNLLSNSLKYIRKDVAPVIEVSCALATSEKIALHPQLDQEGDYYHIRFSDNGIGFDKEYADRIFKIFQRLHGKTEFEGTGIGLSICRKILQAHHGHIAAAVGDNGGAVFNILLPVVNRD